MIEEVQLLKKSENENDEELSIDECRTNWKTILANSKLFRWISCVPLTIDRIAQFKNNLNVRKEKRTLSAIYESLLDPSERNSINFSGNERLSQSELHADN